MSQHQPPIYCQKCGRANGATAPRCIWCDTELKGGQPARFEPTSVEIEHLGGIDGLEEATKVRLSISLDGLDVTDLAGARTTRRIPARSIMDAKVVDASTMEDGGRGRAAWWWWTVVGPFALLIPGKKRPDVKKYDYILAVRYKSGEVKTAAFRREDRMGLVVLEGLARIVTALVQRV